MRTIILPTDFSRPSMNAIHFAMDLLKDDAVRFVLLNVFQRPASGGTMLISIEDILERDSTQQLEQLRDSLTPRLSPSQEIEILPYFGRITDGILNVARSRDAFMIIMGTTGATGLKDLFFGSVAAGVAQKSRIPVLSVPKEYKLTSLDKVVFCSDLKKNNVEADLSALQYILRRFKSSLALVSVQEEVDEEEAKVGVSLIQNFKEMNPELDILDGGDIISELRTYIVEEEPDMIVLIAKDSNSFWDIFNPHLTEYMVKKMPIPILSIPG